jgi:sugar phosphate isomerase/epimerase
VAAERMAARAMARAARALGKIDPDMAVSIEHEDQELDQLEGLRFAAETLQTAASRVS